MTQAPPARKRAATVTRRYAGVDAVARRRERQRKLIDAGLEVFGHRGYHLSTVRDVCAQAGLTERYFDESFKSLAELFDAVYTELRGQLQHQIMQAVIKSGVQSPDPLALAKGTLHAWYTFLKDDPRKARVMLIESAAVSDNGMRSAEATVSEIGGMFRTFITMLYPNLKDSSSFDMDLMLSALTGAAVYMARTWVRSGYKQPIDHVIAHNLALYKSLDLLYRRHDTADKTDKVKPKAAAAKPKSRRPAGA
jgi:AcrR family transcriptional regulator